MMISVTIQIDTKSATPLHAQISGAIEKAIASGTFRGDRNLPSVRALSARLEVSPATVAAAYRDLVERRVVEARSRSGYRISAERARLSALGEATAPGDAPYPLNRIEPNLRIHPVAEIGRIVAEAAAESSDAGGYEDYRGNERLRELMADRFRADGVPAEPANGMLVTAGAQQAIAVVARALGSGARVALEDPTYPGARLAFARAGAELVPIPSTEDGPDARALADAAKRGNIDLFYCCPTYGNPTGRTWSEAARARVLEAAARNGFAILEDDFLGDLDYLDEKPKRLASGFAGSGARVLYVRSYSKCLLPALRVAGIAGPAKEIERLLAVKTTDDICGSALIQRALARYLAEGRYEAHLERVRPRYRILREALRARAAASAPDIRFDDPAGGLCLLATLPAGVDADRFAQESRTEGTLVSSGPIYWASPERGKNRFRVGFGGLEPEEVGKAFDALDRALGRARTAANEDFFARALQ